jgi:hypothetical protein
MVRPTKAYTHSGKVVQTCCMKGKGVGAVLLNRGGGGSGSSYSSLDDYINTTGLNPLSTPKIGKGLGKMNDKLENLLIKTSKGKKEKNITFSL